MGARRWAAAGLVFFGVAFAGQALAGSELGQTFNDARQNGENLVEVVRLALQSGANFTEVAAAANGAGIAADIVTAAALSAGQESHDVARAVEPEESRYDDRAGSDGQGGPGPCPEDKKCQISSAPLCCQTASSDLPKCQSKEKCK